MQNSMDLPGNGGKNTSSRRKPSVTTQQKWTLLNLLTTWFLTDEGKAVIVDPTAGFGASNDEWRVLVKRTGVHMPQHDLDAHWGQMARRDFLNWCESKLPEGKRPRLFSSREAAIAWHEEKISRDFETNEETSKRIEISEDDETSPEAG